MTLHVPSKLDAEKLIGRGKKLPKYVINPNLLWSCKISVIFRRVTVLELIVKTNTVHRNTIFFNIYGVNPMNKILFFIERYDYIT